MLQTVRHSGMARKEKGDNVLLLYGLSLYFLLSLSRPRSWPVVVTFTLVRSFCPIKLVPYLFMKRSRIFLLSRSSPFKIFAIFDYLRVTCRTLCVRNANLPAESTTFNLIFSSFHLLPVNLVLWPLSFFLFCFVLFLNSSTVLCFLDLPPNCHVSSDLVHILSFSFDLPFPRLGSGATLRFSLT